MDLFKKDKKKEDVVEGADAPESGVAPKKKAPIAKRAVEDDVILENLSPYLPSDLIGGGIPYVPGIEEEAVWNAASQACGTERVHYCYTIADDRIWYLACPSASMASNPSSWCPLAAALPGNSEFWDKETVYFYEGEGQAAALRWDPETGRMQIFVGASRSLLPRIQSMDANFVTINQENAKVVPWKNRALHTEKLSRMTARLLLYAGLVLNLVSVLVILGQYLMTNMVQRDLDKVKRDTQRISTELMLEAHKAMQNEAIRHLVRIQELLDVLRDVDGTLVRYEVEKGKVEWEALVPPVIANNVPGLKGQVQPGLEKDGRARITGNR